MALTDKNLDAALAVTRFGLGARLGEIDAARADPRGFLLSQIRAEGADQPQAFTARCRLSPHPSGW